MEIDGTQTIVFSPSQTDILLCAHIHTHTHTHTHTHNHHHPLPLLLLVIRYETPTFHLNGFRVAEGWPPYQGVAPEPAASNLTMWTTMIDAMLATSPY
jgi:hypothetical protein